MKEKWTNEFHGGVEGKNATNYHRTYLINRKFDKPKRIVLWQIEKSNLLKIVYLFNKVEDINGQKQYVRERNL